MKRIGIVIVIVFWLVQSSIAATYYVDINGNDASGDGSSGRPWRTLKFAVSKVPGNQGHTIKLSAGTFIEQGPISVPTKVNIEGSGRSTVLKAVSSLFFNPEYPGYSTEKFLLHFISPSPTDGSQSIKNLTVNGDGKKLHGGVLFQNRDNILVEGIWFEYINFVGLWLWKSKNSRITNCEFLNCAWGSQSYCSGALLIEHLDNVEIDHLKFDEGRGYAVKALYFGKERGRIANTRFHDNRFSVNPISAWGDVNAPNISFELFNTYMENVEIYNNYFDNNLSLACEWRDHNQVAKSVRVYNNFFDMAGRSNRTGYSIELCIDNAEVDHNYFNSGSFGIVNFHENTSRKNWDIHHNTFYGLHRWPTYALKTEADVTNMKFNNNTIEATGIYQTHFIGILNGVTRNLEIKNNLFISSNTEPNLNKLVNIDASRGGSLQNLQVSNNLLTKSGVGNVPGNYSNNFTGVDPQINASGNRPDPYYRPKAGSPLIDKGVNVGYSYSGSAPDIGAYEFGAVTPPPANTPPTIGLSAPSNNSSFAAGTNITLTANAADVNGSISKVEFYNGSTKLGEDTSNPYSYTWNNVPAGTYTITAKATDNQGASTTSSPVTVTVVAATNEPPTVSLTSPANAASFVGGSTVTLNANATDSDGSITKVEFYNGTTKVGEDATGPYSFSWVNVPVGSYSITARATDNKGAVSTSAVRTITIIANALPEVTLTGPSNNASFAEGATLSLAATATDRDGSITRVEFYNGNSKLGEDQTSPYNFSWNNVPAGSYSITARAIDDKGGVTNSAIVRINVSSTNNPPVVKITNPANNSTHVAESSVVISVTASDSDGVVAKVEFFNGTIKIGEDTSHPYTLTWNNLKAGSYNLVAKAIDDKGTSATAQVVILVEAGGMAPVANAGEDITLQLPENSFTLQGSGGDEDGLISTYSWGQLGGPNEATLTANGASGSVNVSNLQEGTYRFILTVTDNGNLTGSDEVIVHVLPASLEQRVQLPKVFTPNNDGIEDTWNWSDTEPFESCKLTIYNRFGQKIYESISYDNSWDGSVNGSPLQEDAYYYVITCDNEDLTGAVRIVR